MRNELTILNALKTVVQTQLSSHLQENLDPIGERNVESDLSNFGIALFIICRKDTQENLTKKIYGYFNALYSLLRTNISLDGEVDFSSITDADFYPAVEGNRNVQAIEVSIAVSYTKDF